MSIFESVVNFFISSAAAASSASPAQAETPASGLSFFLMMGVLVLFLYFIVWRPQRKRDKEVRDLMSTLSKGDEVLTVGGIIGKIAKISDPYVSLTVSESVEITILKTSIANALPKGTLKSI